MNERGKAIAKRLRWRYGPKSKPAKASKYLHHFDEYLKEHPDIVAIIYCRVSEHMQKHTCNLDTIMKVSRKALRKCNIPVAGCYQEVSSGWILNGDRLALVQAVEKAKKYKGKRTIVIVTALSDRFLRNMDFTTKEPDILQTEAVPIILFSLDFSA
jgi:hypothetical protein